MSKVQLQSTENLNQQTNRQHSSINDIGEVLLPNAFASVDLAELRAKQARIEQLEAKIEEDNQSHVLELQSLMQTQMEQFMKTDMRRLNLERQIQNLEQQLTEAR